MNPEEKIKRELWHVMRRLKEEALRIMPGGSLEYWVYFDINSIGDEPTAQNEVKILEKLEHMKIIKIIQSGWEYE